jgi:uncharacterized membrane protein
MAKYREITFSNAIGAAVLASVALLLGRVWYTEDPTYVFLLWNLLLAWIPYGLAGAVEKLEAQKRQPLSVMAPLYIIWLLFFPNAPYILTDFIHLDALTGAVPLWYDVLLVGAFGATGLAFGLKSLHLVHHSLGMRFGRLAGWLTVLLIVLLSGFGVYLGRFPRWNSWDILIDPLRFTEDILHRLTYPLQYPNLVRVTLLFASVVFVSYVAYLALARAWRRQRDDQS